MLDTLIHGAEIYDGVAKEPLKAQAVGIKDGRIAHIGEDLGANAAAKRVDGSGCLLSPGFIDSHASTGLGYLFEKGADNKLFQGVTCELIGNCGTSTAPVGPHLVETMERLSGEIGFPFIWRTLGEYFEKVEDFGLPINLATLAGHSTLRGGALADWKKVSDDERQAMCRALADAMQDGAYGMSSGLIYAPGCYADTQELIDLGKVVAEHGGFYASHIRDERTKLEEAVQEAMDIGKGAGIPVLVSHLKAADSQNWGKIPKVLKQIEDFRAEHDLKVQVDVYPYTAVSTKLRAFLPKDILKDGVEALPEKLLQEDWQQRCVAYLEERGTHLDQMIIISEDIPGTVGKAVTEIAADWQMDAPNAAIELCRRNPDTWMVYHCMSEEDMDAAVLWQDAMVCSDSWSYPWNAPKQIGNPHPRTFGAFSRYLDRYVFSGNKLTYAEAIKKITSIPADFIGLKQRGRLQQGYWADLLLLDPGEFADNATYANPRQFSDGVNYLWLNGTSAIVEGEKVDDKCGRALRFGRD